MTETPTLEKGPIFDTIYHRGENSKGTVILLHGFGANAFDLEPLSQELSSLSLDWIFPNAPLNLGLGVMGDCRAWTSFNMAALPSLFRGAKDLSHLFSVEEMDASRKQVLSWVESLDLDWNKTVLGGFSQGSVVALDCALNMPVKPKGLALLSSSIAHEETLKKQLEGNEKIDFFQSHGRSDEVLPFGLAEGLFQILENAGWSGEWVPFDGGHGIDSVVLDKFRNYLSKNF